MSGKERNLFRMIYQSFISSIKPKFQQRTLIGEDYNGTKYYEVQHTSSSTKKRPSRYFVPVNKDDYEQEIPVEWEAWLRYRRTDPPTTEEIEENDQLRMVKKQNAIQIEAKYSNKELETSKLPVEKEGFRSSFPTYDEYKNNGRDYKVKR